MKANATREFEFTLILTELGERFDEVAEIVYKADFPNALVGVASGVPYVDFSQKAESFPSAVIFVLVWFEQNVTAKHPDIQVRCVESQEASFLGNLNRFLFIKSKFFPELQPHDPYHRILRESVPEDVLIS